MKKTLMLLVSAVSLYAQQNFDFKTLDKLGANAKESTNITLDGEMLRAAGAFLGGDQESLKPVLDKLKGVYVREYKFAKPGQYDEADLAPLRAYLKSLQWSKIIDVKEDKENTEMYVQMPSGSQPGGFAIISAEATEVTVVYISGSVKLSDIGKLSGNLGIPEISAAPGERKSGK